MALLSLAFLSIFATGGLFTFSAIGFLAVYLTLAAAVLGTIIIVYEFMEDPNQFWEERSQITFIIGIALATILAPAQGVGLGTSAQEFYTAIGWVIGTILGVIGAI